MLLILRAGICIGVMLAVMWLLLLMHRRSAIHGLTRQRTIAI